MGANPVKTGGAGRIAAVQSPPEFMSDPKGAHTNAWARWQNSPPLSPERLGSVKGPNFVNQGARWGRGWPEMVSADLELAPAGAIEASSSPVTPDSRGKQVRSSAECTRDETSAGLLRKGVAINLGRFHFDHARHPADRHPGASGFLGGRIVAELNARGHACPAFSRSAARQVVGCARDAALAGRGWPRPPRARRDHQPRRRGHPRSLDRGEKRRVRESRVDFTQRLVAAMPGTEVRALGAPPRSASTGTAATRNWTRIPRLAPAFCRRFARRGSRRPSARPSRACAWRWRGSAWCSRPTAGRCA